MTRGLVQMVQARRGLNGPLIRVVDYINQDPVQKARNRTTPPIYPYGRSSIILVIRHAESPPGQGISQSGDVI